MYSLKLIASLGIVGFKTLWSGVAAAPNNTPTPGEILATVRTSGSIYLQTISAHISNSSTRQLSKTSTQQPPRTWSENINHGTATPSSPPSTLEAFRPGDTPHSGSKVAAYGLFSEVLDGIAAVTMVKHGLSVESFDLNSFYFDCNANSAQSAAPLAPAKVHSAKRVGVQSFYFIPSGLVGII